MLKKLSIIVSFYNEESCIDPFIETTVQEIEKINDLDYEIIFINDCSTDKSLTKLINHHEINKKIKIINLSRRTGPMQSIMAGVQHATGDALVNIDIDLQDPPKLIAEMVKYWREEKYDVVYTTRIKRKGEPFFRMFITKIGYKILKLFSNIPITEQSGDFRLISRRVINEYKKFTEIYPFFRFVVDAIGFKRKQIFYERDKRIKGKTNHPLGLGIIYNFFEISMVPFTDFPVRASLLFGIFSFLICTVILIRTAYLYFIGVSEIGTTAIFGAILLFGGIQSLILGFMAIYIGAILKETKKRPLYIIDGTVGIDNDTNKEK